MILNEEGKFIRRIGSALPLLSRSQKPLLAGATPHLAYGSNTRLAAEWIIYSKLESSFSLVRWITACPGLIRAIARIAD